MRAARFVLLGVAVVTFSGCVTAGNGRMKVLTQQSVSGSLIPGKTTRAEVAEQFGRGNGFHFDSGYEVWVYEYASGIPRFVDYTPIAGHVSRAFRHHTKELRILFDSQGVVRKYLLLANEPGGDVDRESQDRGVEKE